jgi:hypothetical protein
MLQLAVLHKHSLVPPQFFAPSLIHGYRFSPRYVVTVITIAIRLVQPSLYLWSFIMMSYKSCHSTAVISVSQVILSLILSLFIFFVVVLYIYVTNRSIQASQEFGP